MDSKLVIALDVFDADFAVYFARMIGREIFAIKINWPLVMVRGASIISELSQYSRVICDLKIADIPNTNRLIAEKVAENGAWGVISHAFAGSDSLKAVVEAAKNVKVFSVVAMSHPGSGDLISGSLEDLVRISIEADVYGLIAPGNDLDMLKRVKKMAPGMKILSPGIGAQGGSASLAILNGSDYVIVGRSVYDDPDPLMKAREFNREISNIKH
ncbi:MAG: orotidine-5'-phosphate decarboxylase [Candidatus Thermoplasmatota archaeon]|nr:orotidine-5'-phosphate decarboxylase [Candidatus Thermoplasmatota archaeon]MDA8143753.1 orotidine-5'-phosphate decarboxylase [Thermoplasmatales archaeon]